MNYSLPKANYSPSSAFAEMEKAKQEIVNELTLESCLNLFVALAPVATLKYQVFTTTTATISAVVIFTPTYSFPSLSPSFPDLNFHLRL